MDKSLSVWVCGIAQCNIPKFMVLRFPSITETLVPRGDSDAFSASPPGDQVQLLAVTPEPRLRDEL
jgi:hypothetical protein